MLSYSYIWYYIWKNRGHSLNQKEFSTTMTLFMICFCYLIFVMPVTICHILQDLGGHQSHPMVYLAVYCLYWFQYSFNFFIYAFRSGQYRKAYKFFLIEVWSMYYVGIWTWYATTLDIFYQILQIITFIDETLYLWRFIFI